MYELPRELSNHLRLKKFMPTALSLLGWLLCPHKKKKRLRKLVNFKKIPEMLGLVVKSKLPPRSGSSLEAVEPHPQKGAIKFFFFFIWWWVPSRTPKSQILMFSLKTRKSQLKHFMQKPIFLNFVNLFTTFCPDCSIKTSPNDLYFISYLAATGPVLSPWRGDNLAHPMLTL